MQRHSQEHVTPVVRKGNWMQTYTGRAYWPIDPRPEEVNIYDIAHHLSMLCRYTGACKKFYSVAEHSIWVGCSVPVEHALVGLMHDSAEAYVNDIARPLKYSLRDYAEIEDLNWRAIATRFDLPVEIPQCVKDIDQRMCVSEKMAIMGPSPLPWGPEFKEPVPSTLILCLPPEQAERMFLREFARLQRARGKDFS